MAQGAADLVVRDEISKPVDERSVDLRVRIKRVTTVEIARRVSSMCIGMMRRRFLVPTCFIFFLSFRFFVCFRSRCLDRL